jgi:hypothetical protein
LALHSRSRKRRNQYLFFSQHRADQDQGRPSSCSALSMDMEGSQCSTTVPSARSADTMQWGAKNGASPTVTQSAIMNGHQCLQNEVNACRCVQRGPLLQASRLAPTPRRTTLRKAWDAKAFANGRQGSKSVILAAAEPEGTLPFSAYPLRTMHSNSLRAMYAGPTEIP